MWKDYKLRVHVVNLIFSGFYPDMFMVGHLFRFGNNYLFFFKVSVWAPPEQIDQGQFALDVAVEVLEYYEQKFKVDYPLPKQGTC